MRLAWATDIHLNFLSTTDRRRFLDSITGQADALLVTGDIAESNSLGEMSALARKGLVTADRHLGRCPVVTALDTPEGVKESKGDSSEGASGLN